MYTNPFCVTGESELILLQSFVAYTLNAKMLVGLPCGSFIKNKGLSEVAINLHHTSASVSPLKDGVEN
jgi:hypothetical protein